MAITSNTTKTIGKTSTVLMDRCEATKKNMKTLIRKAGVTGTPVMEKVYIPMIPGSKDDVQYVGLNGVDFYFLRGQYHDVPKEVAAILKDCGIVPVDNAEQKG